MTERVQGLFSGSVRHVHIRGRSPLAAALVVLAALLLVALVLVLLVPLLILGAVGGLAMLVGNRVRALFTRAKAPNGALDGRKNVRVIVRE